MKSYTVHRPRRSIGDPAAEADRTVFVKEGFCWPALFVPFIWLLYRMLWLVLLAYLASLAALVALVEVMDLGETVAGVIAIGIQVALATEANDLRRWTLRRRGYEFVDVAYGPSLFEAELRYFRSWSERLEAFREAAAGAEAEIAFRSAAGATDQTGTAPA